MLPVRALAQTYGDWLVIDEIPLAERTRKLYARFGIRQEGYYAIRPDSYVAYRGASLDFAGFAAYLQRC